MVQQKQKQQQPKAEEKKGIPLIANRFAIFEVHRRLPLEMECEMFKCLKLDVQKNSSVEWAEEFIAYSDTNFSQRLCNSKGNGWNRSSTKLAISPGGLKASSITDLGQNIFAAQAFPILGANCRTDNFPGTILYYFEVTKIASFDFMWSLWVGLSDGTISDPGDDDSLSADTRIGSCPNYYAFLYDRFAFNDWCLLSGQQHRFRRPNGGAIRPKWNGWDIIGCGLLLNPANKLSIFFTANGILMGKQIPICPSVDRLFPTARTANASFEANFGDNPDKPFKYDIKKCPGLVYD